MNDNVTDLFPRRFFFSEKRKGRLGINTQAYLASNNQVILSIIRESLPEEGSFFLHQNGSVQIRVEEGYFDDLLPLVEENIFSQTFDLCKSSILAFTSEEMAKNTVDLSLLPRSCSFRIQGCYGIEPVDSEHVFRVWVLLVQSEQLEGLRLKHGLSKWAQNQPSYILMGVEKYYRSFEETFKKIISFG